MIVFINCEVVEALATRPGQVKLRDLFERLRLRDWLERARK